MDSRPEPVPAKAGAGMTKDSKRSAQQRPQAGSARILGLDAWRLRSRAMALTGVVPERPDAPPALNARQRERLSDVSAALRSCADLHDPLLIAENLRQARSALDALVGRTSTEDVLDALFGRFCIGK